MRMPRYLLGYFQEGLPRSSFLYFSRVNLRGGPGHRLDVLEDAFGVERKQ